MREGKTPMNLAALPTRFRLTSLVTRAGEDQSWVTTATLFHELASLKVRWTSARPDSRLRVHQLVSPRWKGEQPSSEDGAIFISRLVPIERPEAELNLFELVPSGWVRDRELVRQGRALIEALPSGHRHLFNAIFWEGERFRRFCIGPSSMSGHHRADHGNLAHALEVAALMRENCGRHDFMSTPVGILAGLLHDAGKADEYELGPRGDWVLSERGRLLGHRVTNIEWIAAAMAGQRIVLPDGHYQALLHCLTASQGAPEWLGIRKPAMLEALLLSDMDRLSGRGNLIRGCRTVGQEGWGRMHPHLPTQPYVLPEAEVTAQARELVG